jgi:hypothetical protein
MPEVFAFASIRCPEAASLAAYAASFARDG